MPANNQKYNNNNGPKKRRPVRLVLKLFTPGTDHRGVSYDTSTVIDIMKKLADASVFSMMSVTITVNKAKYLNDKNAKGVMTIARIQSYDPETNTVSISFFGEYGADIAKAPDDYVVVPKVLVTHNTDKVATILSFQIWDKDEVSDFIAQSADQ